MRDAGFSLVELLIALVLGMVLITGAGYLFLSANKTYTLQDQLIRMQENGRTAIELLTQDLRMSAYTGCHASARLGNGLYTVDLGRLWMAHFDKGVLGISSGSSAKKAVDSYALSEAIVIHRLDWENSFSVTSQNTNADTVTLSASHNFNKGDLLALVGQECKQISVFIAGSDTRSAQVSYASAGGSLLSNCTTQHQGRFNCMDGETGAGTFDHAGSQLMPVSSVAYYIRDSNGIPTFYRKRGGETVSGRKLSAEALVAGIETLRFLYGYDSDEDGVVNQYVQASAITPYSQDWQNVLSVKVEFLVRSLRETASQPQSYFFAGTEVMPDDRYIRKTLVTTVDIRNRTR